MGKVLILQPNPIVIRDFYTWIIYFRHPNLTYHNNKYIYIK